MAEIWKMRPPDFVQWSEHRRLYLANYFDADQQTIAYVLRVREEPGRLLGQTLADYLYPKKLLLLFDNCDQDALACY